MKINPECRKHCPRILDAAEGVGRLGRTGVVAPVNEVIETVEAIIDACVATEPSCDGPTLHETPPRARSFLGRLGLAHAKEPSITYVCPVTGEGPRVERYLFPDTK